MAAANINVNKLTVLEFLATGQKIPFLIPEYQVPIHGVTMKSIRSLMTFGASPLSTQSQIAHRLISWGVLSHI